MQTRKQVNQATHIQLCSLSLKAKLLALSEQRAESLNDTVKAVIAAGIIELTKDDRAAFELPAHVREETAQETTHA